MAQQRPFIAPADAQSPLVAAVDLGGTNTKIGVVDSRGRTLGYNSIPTQVERGPDDAIERMRIALEKVLSSAGLEMQAIARIGLGSPGPMDIRQGKLLTPGNLPGWWQFPIRDALSRACSLPVTFANDANAAAYGEFWQGRGRDWASLVMFTLGTGVGGGIVLDGGVLEGQHSAGGELGHMTIDESQLARKCSCGRRGHLEAYASATAVVERAREGLVAGSASSLSPRIAAGETLSALMIDQEAERGDTFCGQLVDETARYLGIGVATVIQAIDPEGVVLGGAMTFGGHDAATGRRFLDAVRREAASRVFANLAESLQVNFALLGGDAGYIGAAGLALRDVQKAKPA